MTRVLVQNTKIRELKGKDKDGNPTLRLIQDNVYVDLGMERFQNPVMLENGQPPYVAGEYELDLAARFTKGQYGIEEKKYPPFIIKLIKAAA
jgi:hypothetical protein